ncbi:MAG: OFA family MFS transporter [Anaeromyxobacter sp.]
MTRLSSNRWIVAAAGTLGMAVLGTVYSWSLFTQPLIAAFGWSSATATWAFSLAIFSLGVGATLGGRWQDRVGPRPVAVTGFALWALGNVLAGLGTARLGAPWLYATYGVMGGLGLGLGYVTPVSAVTKWFPDRRGLGSGLVVMGFGLGAFGYSTFLKSWPAFAAVSHQAVEVVAARAHLAPGQPAPALPPEAVALLMSIFLWSGAVYAVVGIACALLVRNPPPQASAPAAAAGAAPASALDLPPSQALRTGRFWALWGMLFLDVTAGILFISSAVPIMRELTGAAPAAAVAVYGVLALFNGLGRLVWGALSDRLGRNLAYVLIFGSQALIFAAVGGVHTLGWVGVLFAVVLLGYGGGFGVMPSFVADHFGTRSLGVNYGWVLTAWGVGGVVGPIFAATVKDATGSYAGALPVIAVMLAAAVLLPVLTRAPGAGPDQRWAHLRPPARRAKAG